MDPLVAIPMLISVLPGLLLLAAISRSGRGCWLAALVGGAGWLAALIAREPLLLLVESLGTYPRICLAASMAGVFEETSRYLVLRYFASVSRSRSVDPYTVLSIGLGWGLAEALLLYVVQVPLAVALYGYQWTDLLPGAIERNSATAFHPRMAMSMLRGWECGGARACL